MATVLVTAIGSVAGDITIKSLKRLGHRVVGSDVNPKECIPDALEVDAFYPGVYSTDQDRYLEFIADVCHREQVDYVFPMTDVEVDVFNANRERVAQLGVVPCISPKHALDVARNKKKLADFIDSNVPSVKSIETRNLVDCEGNPFGYPVVLKPFDGRSSIGLHIVHDEREWDFVLAHIDDRSRYIVQPFVSGPIVMAEICRNPESGKCAVVVREELMATPHGCGLSVLMYHDEGLEEQCRELANALDIRGSVNFEWIRDADGNYHFVECNSRFSAGAEFTVMSGYDLVTNHLRCFQGKDIEDFRFQHRMVISRKYEEFITKVFDE